MSLRLCSRAPRTWTNGSWGVISLTPYPSAPRGSMDGDRVADAPVASVDDQFPVAVLAGVPPGCLDRLLLGLEVPFGRGVFVLERPAALVGDDVDPVGAR